MFFNRFCCVLALDPEFVASGTWEQYITSAIKTKILTIYEVAVQTSFALNSKLFFILHYTGFSSMQQISGDSLFSYSPNLLSPFYLPHQQSLVKVVKHFIPLREKSIPSKCKLGKMDVN